MVYYYFIKLVNKDQISYRQYMDENRQNIFQYTFLIIVLTVTFKFLKKIKYMIISRLKKMQFNGILLLY